MIHTYHAHIYFSLDEMALATQVRENIIKELPQLTYAGQLIPIAIGPHPKPMFEMHIPASHINLAMATHRCAARRTFCAISPSAARRNGGAYSGCKMAGRKISA